MALFEVAQAVTMQKFGPCRPNSIEIRPLAMLLISIGMVKAKTRDGPFVNRIVVLILKRFQSADSAADDDAETIGDSASPDRSPLSSIAIFAAAMASCAKRSVRRTSFGFLKNGFGSKSRTSPPIWQS